MKTDNVNHPSHYTGHPSGVECIVLAEEMNFCVGNAFKYLFRCDKKNNILEDLNKAKWYIEREIKRRKNMLFRFFVGDSDMFSPRIDGSVNIRYILYSETRFYGRMASALSHLYTAHRFPRDTKALEHAQHQVEVMIRIQETQSLTQQMF